jgi:hypothetical protein
MALVWQKHETGIFTTKTHLRLYCTYIYIYHSNVLIKQEGANESFIISMHQIFTSGLSHSCSESSLRGSLPQVTVIQTATSRGVNFCLISEDKLLLSINYSLGCKHNLSQWTVSVYNYTASSIISAFVPKLQVFENIACHHLFYCFVWRHCTCISCSHSTATGIVYRVTC